MRPRTVFNRLRPHSAYDVMAAIAFFAVVAGGSAYAAATIGSGDIKKDAVLSKHIKNGQVAGKDLAGNAVNGKKVAANSLTGADVDESTLRVSNIIARPAGGTLSANGLTTSSTTPYQLANATFTQRPGEILEVVDRGKSTVATPSSSPPNTLCQIGLDLKLDGKLFEKVDTPGGASDQPVTKSGGVRLQQVVPIAASATQHSFTATAHLVDHSPNGFTDACSSSSRVDSFELDVIGVR